MHRKAEDILLLSQALAHQASSALARGWCQHEQDRTFCRGPLVIVSFLLVDPQPFLLSISSKTFSALYYTPATAPWGVVRCCSRGASSSAGIGDYMLTTTGCCKVCTVIYSLSLLCCSSRARPQLRCFRSTISGPCISRTKVLRRTCLLGRRTVAFSAQLRSNRFGSGGLRCHRPGSRKPPPPPLCAPPCIAASAVPLVPYSYAEVKERVLFLFGTAWLAVIEPPFPGLRVH
jgi:hypothetical protein